MHVTAVCLVLLSATCHCSHLLVYMQMPFYSHQVAFKPLWLELARRGHKITLIQPNRIMEDDENITTVVLEGTYHIWNKYNLSDRLGKGESIVSVATQSIQCIREILQYQITHPGLKEYLDGRKKADVVLAEYMVAFGSAIGYKLKVPVIGIASMDPSNYVHMDLGNPTHPVAYPDRDADVSTCKSLRERFKSFFVWLCWNLMDLAVMTPMQEQVLREYLGEVPPLRELARNTSLLLINANPLFSPVRPLGPKSVTIGGGVHLLPGQPLPKVFCRVGKSDILAIFWIEILV